MRSLGSIFAGNAWQWDSRLCNSVCTEQDGRAEILGVQFGSCRLFHGDLSRYEK